MATWKVVDMERNTADGGVTVVHWDVTEVDGDYSARVYGSVGLEYDASDPAFIPYDQLTENDVIVWVWTQVNKIETETNLANDIAAQKNPTKESGTPW
jgi:hypothetical protein